MAPILVGVSTLNEVHPSSQPTNKPLIMSTVVQAPLATKATRLTHVLNFISKTPPSSSFTCLYVLDIDHDTLIPSYFDDPITVVCLTYLLPQ